MKKSTTSRQDLSELVASVSESDAKSFLLEVLCHDELFAMQFRQQFGPIDAEAAKAALRHQIEGAIWEFGDRGFINWRASSGFERRYREVVSTAVEPLINRDALDAALAVSLQVLRSLQDVQIDDSDGFTGDAIDDVRDYWEQMLARGDVEFSMRLFDEACKFISKRPKGERLTIFEFEEEMAEDFLMDTFPKDPAFSERVLAFVDERIRRANRDYRNASQELERVQREIDANGKSGSKRSGYGAGKGYWLEREVNAYAWRMRDAIRTRSKWLLVRIEALAASGAEEGLLLDEAGTCLTDQPICQFFVDRALAGKDYDRAIQLLQDCKASAMELENGTYPMVVSEQLAELLKDRDVAGMREELVYLTQHSSRNDVSSSASELWNRLRSSYSEDEWLAVRDDYLDKLSNASARRDCLVFEGLFERLMDEVEKDSIYALESYEDVLVEHYPDRVVGLYLNDLESDRSYPGRDRKGYREFAARLRHIKSLPGGEEPVARIVAATREKFPRRPALLDELSRV